VTVSKGTRSMDGKSIMGLLLLSAAQGTIITIRAEGPDEGPAVAALVSLVEQSFAERP
jgi:phosphocarrier protein